MDATLSEATTPSRTTRMSEIIIVNQILNKRLNVPLNECRSDGKPTFFCGAAVAGTGVSISQSERTTINYKSKCNFNGDLYGNNCCRM